MPRPLSFARRLPSDQHTISLLDHLSTGDVLQRLAILSPEKLRAIDQLARLVLVEELDIAHD